MRPLYLLLYESFYLRDPNPAADLKVKEKVVTN